MINLRYLGLSAFELISDKGLNILIDPFISENPACPIKADEIKNANIILVTHGAFDHVGDSFELAKRTGALLVCGHEVSVNAMQEGVPENQIKRLSVGRTMSYEGIKIRSTPALHISFLEFNGKFASGQPLGFIIYTEDGTRIYHAGDTTIFSDLRLLSDLYHPQIALFPVEGMIEPLEAALAMQWLKPDIVIPTHYKSGSKNPVSFVEEVTRLASYVTPIIMKPGESLKYSKAKAEIMRNLK